MAGETEPPDDDRLAQLRFLRRRQIWDQAIRIALLAEATALAILGSIAWRGLGDWSSFPWWPGAGLILVMVGAVAGGLWIAAIIIGAVIAPILEWRERRDGSWTDVDKFDRIVHPLTWKGRRFH